MGPLFEPETPSKCFFEARGDVASPNEAGGIIIEAIVVPIIAHNRITSSGGGSTITADGDYSHDYELIIGDDRIPVAELDVPESFGYLSITADVDYSHDYGLIIVV
ncbi:hypothetical protein ARMSODRAFT_1089848 [Armillaria solidipes]|uniref:Uncharacterized protein n=1 Tax=Armillaria solidipes TaxID=1076256 RepID=A0A2H3B560_9AGAR|nr:hypothetical protein ARMSODRAFT_1089848 [Armillaria solidipes]